MDSAPLLLPLLDAALAARGHLEPADVEAAAREARVPLAQAWEAVRFYPRYRTEPPEKRFLLVDDPVVRGRDFARLWAELEDAAPRAEARAGTVYSQGLEAVGPALVIEERARWRVFAPVQVADLRALAVGKLPPHELEALPAELARAGGVLFEPPDPLPEFPGADALIGAVREAGLRGLGGALFPTARKLEAVRAEAADAKYVVVNGDESEPGNFKDRWLMEHNPRLVWAGAALAARAVGAGEIVFYVRGEYAAAHARVEAARAELEASGYFEGLKTQTFRGGGLYICGEESALLESIEGRRAEPRLKPPYPAQAGLFGRPTLVNNVETLAHLAWIAAHGAEAYRARRPKLFSISGDVARPGVYELPLGTPLAGALEAAGGAPEDLQAVLMGGAAGTFLRLPDAAELPLDFEAPRLSGDAVGPGALVAFGGGRDLWAVAEGIAAFFAHESCGKCFSCSLGTPHLHAAVARRERGPQLEELFLALEQGSLCGLGQAAPWAVRSLIRRFEGVRS
ncbi:NADH-ubiquinone oxidoreductase-F iron-sulfur binding region domain-containing protein [Oceanithermus profundus]|uniref:NADH-ubiquinone oxidoreductase-F iron-sulfur binding region domain-containing protein n=1 Tax=Oceanithermus profundus TaxID=187137 RepID=UPI0002E4D6E6|nr:NADH-ubiquinone oxidoreductase-F iron-sulfur binding region domain-containing protein [Oceanithermus profundus]